MTGASRRTGAACRLVHGAFVVCAKRMLRREEMVCAGWVVDVEGVMEMVGMDGAG